MTTFVLAILEELSDDALLSLKDPKLQVAIVPEGVMGAVWAYFPPPSPVTVPWWHARRAASIEANLRAVNAVGIEVPTKAAIALSMLEENEIEAIGPAAKTRVLLVLSEAEFLENPDTEALKADLRDNLGHVLLYLRNPAAPNECSDAIREWRRNCKT